MSKRDWREGRVDIDAAVKAIDDMPGLPGETRAEKEAGFLELCAQAGIARVHAGGAELPIARYVVCMDESEIQGMAKELQYFLRNVAPKGEKT